MKGRNAVSILLVLLRVVTSITQTFEYTGSCQEFIVPVSVRNIKMMLTGAQGGGTSLGAVISANVPVEEGETLYVFVGGTGSCTSVEGGFNGGGAGTYAIVGTSGCSGGGASDVRRDINDLSTRLITAGGGGGGVVSTLWGSSTGGAGNCPRSHDGKGPLGGGSVSYKQDTAAVQTQGGLSGFTFFSSSELKSAGEAGVLGLGGAGGSSSSASGGGGGGGGGYYGGSGGGGGAASRSGGGGSSYSPYPYYCISSSSSNNLAADTSPHGRVVFTYTADKTRRLATTEDISLIPTESPTIEPSYPPTVEPTVLPSEYPTELPTEVVSTEAATEPPTTSPTVAPTLLPTEYPTLAPTLADGATAAPSVAPSQVPTMAPTDMPSMAPTATPTGVPSVEPSVEPTTVPTIEPTTEPTVEPSVAPTTAPSLNEGATTAPSAQVSTAPSLTPTTAPSEVPTEVPTHPTFSPTIAPSVGPTPLPGQPTFAPTVQLVYTFTVTQNLLVISRDTFYSDPNNAQVFTAAAAAAMPPLTPNDISITSVTDVTTGRRLLRTDRQLAISGVSVLYSVVFNLASTGYNTSEAAYTSFSNGLKDSVASGNFNSLLQSYAVYFDAPAMIGVTSDSVTTTEPTLVTSDDDNGKGKTNSKLALILGLVLGLGGGLCCLVVVCMFGGCCDGYKTENDDNGKLKRSRHSRLPIDDDDDKESEVVLRGHRSSNREAETAATSHTPKKTPARTEGASRPTEGVKKSISKDKLVNISF